jgi:hypothetical protein
MKNIIFHKIFKSVSVSLILFLAASVVWANNNKFANDKAVSLVTQNLAARLKAELAQENLSLELMRVQKTALSKNEMLLTGNAFCILKEENTQLPISFEAKVNLSKQAVDAVVFDFLEGEFVPAYDEEILTKNLLKQISRDYKTNSVVIALDGFEASENLSNQKEFKGSAEVKIGEVEWKRIDFDVLMTRENTPIKVTYSVKK